MKDPEFEYNIFRRAGYPKGYNGVVNMDKIGIAFAEICCKTLHDNLNFDKETVTAGITSATCNK